MFLRAAKSPDFLMLSFIFLKRSAPRVTLPPNAAKLPALLVISPANSSNDNPI